MLKCEKCALEFKNILEPNSLFRYRPGNLSGRNGHRKISKMSGKYRFNLLTPNVNYSGRTAPLTSKVAFYIFIQHIQVLNILNMVYTLRFFLFKILFVS